MKKTFLTVFISAFIISTVYSQSGLNSGMYKAEQIAYGNVYNSTFIFTVTGNTINGLSFWGPGTVHEIKGTINGTTVTFTRTWDKIRTQVFTGTIKGDFIEGIFKATLENGGEGTWKMYLK